MEQVKKTGGAAVIAFSLLAGMAHGAPGFSFDSPSAGFPVAGLREQAARAEVPLPVPVPAERAGTQGELTDFWDSLGDSWMSDACRSLQVNLSGGASLADVAGLNGGLKRRLRRFPAGGLALVDEVKLRLQAGFAPQVLQVPGFGHVSVGVTGGLQGISQVVRPLKGDNSCKHVPDLLDLRKVKTVLPVTAERLGAMAAGEIWKLPVTARYAFSAGAGGTAGAGVAVTISGEYSRERRPIISLYKMDAATIRMRLRLEHVTVQTLGAQAQTLAIPSGDIGLAQGESALGAMMNHSLAGAVNDLLAAKLGFKYFQRGGQKLMMEFLVDARDPAQLARLAKFLGGDFDSLTGLIEMGIGFSGFSEDETGVAGTQAIGGAASQAGALVGSAPGYAGSDNYTSQGGEVTVHIPVIQDYDYGWTDSYHRYQSLDGDGTVLHVHQGESREESETLLSFKHNTRQSVYLIDREGADGRVAEPVLLYQAYEAVGGASTGGARDLVAGVNDIMRYAGMRGNGTTAAHDLNAAALLPAGGDYDSTLVAFRLLLSRRALHDFVYASTADIMRAYLNMKREEHPRIIDKIKGLLRVSEKGAISYNENQVAHSLGVSAESPVMGLVNDIVYGCARFLVQAVAARGKADWKARSEALSLLATSGPVKFSGFLKVAVQLTDASNIGAETTVQSSGVNRTVVQLGSDAAAAATAAEFEQMRDRFNDPSLLTD